MFSIKSYARLQQSARFFSSANCLKAKRLPVYSKWAHQQYEQIHWDHRILLTQMDGAGTIFDPYCLAPYLAFSEIFSAIEPNLSHEQITGPMGMSKIEHIRHLLKELSPQWVAYHHRPSTEHDVDRLHEQFTQILNKNIAEYSTPLPFAMEAMRFLGEARIRTAFTTGYSSMTAQLALTQFNKRMEFDDIRNFNAMTASNEVSPGTRYAMLLNNMEKLCMPINQISRTLFVTDAKSDIDNVKQAKEIPWIFAVANYSTHVGITKLVNARFPPEERLKCKREAAVELLKNSRPHAVLNNLSELPLAILAASRALARGETPTSSPRLEIEYPEPQVSQAHSLLQG